MTKKLYIKFYDPWGNCIISNTLEHCDVSTKLSIFYSDNILTSGAKVVRLTEKLVQVNIMNGVIQLNYESGAWCELTRE